MDSARRSGVERVAFLFFVVVFIALIARCFWLQKQLWLRPNTKGAVSEPFVSGDSVLRLRLLDAGKPTSIQPFLAKGRTLIYFFSRKCPACVQEEAAWRDYLELHGSDAVLFVRLDHERPTDIRKRNPHEYGLVRDRAAGYKLAYMPQIVVVDGCGIVRATFRTVQELAIHRGEWLMMGG